MPGAQYLPGLIEWHHSSLLLHGAVCNVIAYIDLVTLISNLCGNQLVTEAGVDVCYFERITQMTVVPCAPLSISCNYSLLLAIAPNDYILFVISIEPRPPP